MIFRGTPILGNLHIMPIVMGWIRTNGWWWLMVIHTIMGIRNQSVRGIASNRFCIVLSVLYCCNQPTTLNVWVLGFTQNQCNSLIVRCVLPQLASRSGPSGRKPVLRHSEISTALRNGKSSGCLQLWPDLVLYDHERFPSGNQTWPWKSSYL